MISLQNLDRENAFSDSDVRLLMTLAGSLSVALENARLFDETKRLLTETDERAAELALINSVQEGLAQNLDMQAMYDLVGDRIQEIFDAQVVDIGIFDFEAGLIHYPYTIERGVRFPDESTPLKDAVMAQVLLETRQPLLVNDIPSLGSRERDAGPGLTGRTGPFGPPRAAHLRRPDTRPHLAPEPRPHERVLRDRYASADHARRQSQRRPGERAAVRRDEATRRRAGDRERRPGRAGRGARTAGHVRARREREQATCSTPRWSISPSSITRTAPWRSRFPSSAESGSPTT